MTTSPAETTTLGWQSLTTVVTARDTDIDPGITDMSTVEDGVTMLGMVAGTHCESLMNLAPTGQPFESPYVRFCRIDEGQLEEIRSLLDGFGSTQQLGVIPNRPRIDRRSPGPNVNHNDSQYSNDTSRTVHQIIHHDGRRSPGGIPRWQPVTGC